MQDIVLFIQHHWLLNLILFVVLLLLMLLELLTQKQGGPRLSPLQVVQLINHDNAVIVDVRNPALFVEGHIIDAVSIPADDIAEKWKKLEKFRSKPIILTCQSGTDSSRAAAFLTKQGFDIKTLTGGLRAWREADMPLVKG